MSQRRVLLFACVLNILIVVLGAALLVVTYEFYRRLDRLERDLVEYREILQKTSEALPPNDGGYVP